MNNELILLRFLEVERNLRDIQDDIREIKSDISSICSDIDENKRDIDENKRDIDMELDTEISRMNTTIDDYKSKFSRLESRLYDVGRLFRDTFASSFSKPG